ncbi:MAG: flagellar hook-associated 2 domain-containing protein [Acidobacteria bacterium]|nr:MAG: flagellar hook-associated 2 domain-containing protein [Acidobacteriota bacterium]
MSTSSSPLGGISGATSTGNFNAQAYVQAIIQAESGPEQLMQQQVSVLSSQASALSTISSQLSALQTAVLALNDFQGALAAQKATSSNTGVATVTAGAGATSGTHSLTVSTLATTSSEYTNTLASGTTTFTTGSFSVAVGSNAPTVISVTSSNNTLNGLAASINSAGAGVTASVITDSSGARLSLVSNTTGAPGDLTISSNTTGLTFTKAVTGTNASYTLDGIALNSTSNSITGALAGVTLNLAGTTASPVTITVAPDTSQATTAIQNFVSAYNTVIQSLNQQFTYDPTTQSTGPLGTDQIVMQLQQSVLGDASYSISGNSGYTNLASIGINMNADGTLAVDSGQLSAAMAANYSAVQNLFQQVSPTGFAQNFTNDLTNLTSTTGPVAEDQQGISQQTNDLNQQIADFQANLNAQEQELMQVYSQVAVTIGSLPGLLSQTQSELAKLP